LTASNDGTVRLFNSATGAGPHDRVRPVPATYAESDATADRVLVSSADGTAHLERYAASH
jgi:hypothetical protein